MSITFCLVGSGNIGSRHLQGLIASKLSSEIFVVEPNPKSIENTRKIAANTLPPEELPKIIFLDSLDKLPSKSDLSVVATSSAPRTHITKTLLNKGHKRFLLEKIVTQSAEDYSELVNLMEENKAKAWVNTVHRLSKGFETIRPKLGEKPIRFAVTRGTRGFACNIIHYLDLFLFLAQEREVRLNGSLLDEEILENKRGKDFLEFKGTVFGKTPKGSTFSITALDYPSNITVDIAGNNSHYLYHETFSKLISMNEESFPTLDCTVDYVSQTTSCLSKEIISTDQCRLPRLSELQDAHSETFRIFNSHLKKVTGKDYEKCPIT